MSSRSITLSGSVTIGAVYRAIWCENDNFELLPLCGALGLLFNKSTAKEGVDFLQIYKQKNNLRPRLPRREKINFIMYCALFRNLINFVFPMSLFMLSSILTYQNLL